MRFLVQDDESVSPHWLRRGSDQHGPMAIFKLMGKAPKDLRGRDISGDLDEERASAKEIDLLEKKQAMKELLKEKKGC